MAKRAKQTRGPGSQTNASDAVDAVEVGSDPTVEEVVDAGVAGTFPASDPVSATQPGPHAEEHPTKPAGLPPRNPHAADWMFRR
jgi:hypothetical protein